MLMHGFVTPDGTRSIPGNVSTLGLPVPFEGWSSNSFNKARIFLKDLMSPEYLKRSISVLALSDKTTSNFISLQIVLFQVQERSEERRVGKECSNSVRSSTSKK